MAINLDDSFDLVAVWQWEDRKWQLLQLARPQKAIALCRKNSMMRLVFPTGVNPNHPKKQSRSRKNKLMLESPEQNHGSGVLKLQERLANLALQRDVQQLSQIVRACKEISFTFLLEKISMYAWIISQN